MQPNATDVAWQGLSVRLLGTCMSPAEMAKLIKKPFVGLTCMGPRNHILDRFRNPPGEGETFGGCPDH